MTHDENPQWLRETTLRRLGKILLAGLSQAAILLFAFRSTHSTGEFLVLGLGPALLMDRYIFRLLPWTYPLTWVQELMLRAAYVGLGGVGYSLALAGIIRAEEAFSLGVALSLAAFLFECLFGLATKALRPTLRGCTAAVVRKWQLSILHFRFCIFDFPLLIPCPGRSVSRSHHATLPLPRRRTAWTPLPHVLFFCPAIVCRPTAVRAASAAFGSGSHPGRFGSIL